VVDACSERCFGGNEDAQPAYFLNRSHPVHQLSRFTVRAVLLRIAGSIDGFLP
jgi:hypothetical protein